MARKEVVEYQLAWQYSRNNGTIVLLFQGGGFKQLDFLTYESYTAMVDMLRNEKPIWYDESQSLIATYHEAIGEGE